MNLEISLSFSPKEKLKGIFTEIRFKNLRGDKEIWGWLTLTMLSFPNHWHNTSLHLVRSWMSEVLPIFLEKAMAPHSSTLAWKIPWTEEPGRLQAMGSLRVRHDWATSLSLFNFMHWKRKWQPTPVFLLGESQRWGSLVGCHLWGRKESDTTERLNWLTDWGKT